MEENEYSRQGQGSTGRKRRRERERRLRIALDQIVFPEMLPLNDVSAVVEDAPDILRVYGTCEVGVDVMRFLLVPGAT